MGVVAADTKFELFCIANLLAAMGAFIQVFQYVLMAKHRYQSAGNSTDAE